MFSANLLQPLLFYLVGNTSDFVGWVTCDPRAAMVKFATTTWVQEPTILGWGCRLKLSISIFSAVVERQVVHHFTKFSIKLSC